MKAKLNKLFHDRKDDENGRGVSKNVVEITLLKWSSQFSGHVDRVLHHYVVSNNRQISVPPQLLECDSDSEAIRIAIAEFDDLVDKYLKTKLRDQNYLPKDMSDGN